MTRGSIASLAVSIALLVCTGATARAHDMGRSRAVVVFHADGRYAIDVLVDPQNLLAQLALSSGDVPPDRVDAQARVALVRARIASLADGVDLYFDDNRVAPLVEYQASVNAALAAGLDAAAIGDAGTLRLSGTMPSGARRFSLAYRWIYGAMPVTIRAHASTESRVLWVGPGERSQEVALTEMTTRNRVAVASEYLQLGFTHILPKGLDHILFVLGLFFLSAGWRALLLQVSTFTVAHTITLGLTMLRVVSVGPSIVEPLIALSIAYIAIENLTTRTLRPSRLVLIFGFGLLHGMGFAGVLNDLGLPATRFVVALLSFNLGVEVGQIAVLAAATLVVAGWRRREASLLPLVARPASMLIAASGLYWTVQRMVQ